MYYGICIKYNINILHNVHSLLYGICFYEVLKITTQVHLHAGRINFTTGNCSFIDLFTVLRTLRSKPFGVANASF